jgi:hypothetical protein
MVDRRSMPTERDGKRQETPPTASCEAVFLSLDWLDVLRDGGNGRRAIARHSLHDEAAE